MEMKAEFSEENNLDDNSLTTGKNNSLVIEDHNLNAQTLASEIPPAPMTQRNTTNQPIYNAQSMDEVRQKNNNSALLDRSRRSNSNTRSQTRNKTKIQY